MGAAGRLRPWAHEAPHTRALRLRLHSGSLRPGAARLDGQEHDGGGRVYGGGASSLSESASVAVSDSKFVQKKGTESS